MRVVRSLLIATAVAALILANVSVALAADLTISVGDPIDSAHVTSIHISGVADTGATVQVTMTDVNLHTKVDSTTAGPGDSWSLTEDLTLLDDGMIQFDALCTAGCTGATTNSTSAFKDTVTTVTIQDWPLSGIDPDHGSAATPAVISGIAEMLDTVNIDVSDGTHHVTDGTTASDGSWSFSLDLSGLDNGADNITIRVDVTDSYGNAASDEKTVGKSWLPDQPAKPTTEFGNGQVTVTWVAPYDGFSAITGFDVSTYQGGSPVSGKTCTGGATDTSCAVTGLTNGTAYTFRVTASNVNGSSPESVDSVETTPSTTPAKPAKPTTSHADQKITVGWVAPDDGGAALTGYDVAMYEGASLVSATECSVDGSTTTCDATGLTNGTAYTFTVTASNANGAGPVSDPSDPATPSTNPAKPSQPMTSKGDARVAVSWIAPTDDGGAAIDTYDVATYDAGTLVPAAVCSATAPAVTCDVTGLTNGTAYTFTVTAHNLNGWSDLSDPSDPVTPSTTPAKPDRPTTTHHNTTVDVRWAVPDDGGSAIVAFHVATYEGGALVAGCDGGSSATECTVSGLINGAAYTFTVTAENANGLGSESDPSDPATPSTTPGKPAKPTAARGNNLVTVQWVAPANNGAPITGYQVATYQGGSLVVGAVCSGGPSGTSCDVTGLTNGTAYTFTVTASNIDGPGAASDPSDPMIPSDGPMHPGAPTGVTATKGRVSATVSWTAPLDDGGAAIDRYTATAVQDGTKSCTTANGSTTSCVIGSLSSSISYTFQVRAHNSQGDSDPSTASSPAIQPDPATVPGAPTIGSAVGLDASARVTWTAPTDDGGAGIDSYTVTSSSGQICTLNMPAAALACTFAKNQLANHNSYTFTVKAHNAAGASPASTASSSVVPRMGDSYVAVTPSRVLNQATLQAGQGNTMHPLTFQVTDKAPGDSATNIPPDAVAVTGVLSVASPSSLGYLALTPAPPTGAPSTSTLNFPAADARATGVTVPLSPLQNGFKSLSVTYVANSGTAKVNFDVSGYFIEGTGGTTYVSLTPTRILDTRYGLGGTTLRTGSPNWFQVTGRGGVPSWAVAVTGTVTLTTQSSNGFVSVGPVSVASPTTATIFSPRYTRTNHDNRATGVTIKLDGSGRLSATWVGTAGSTADLIFDVNGYFVQGPAGAMYVPVTPNRLLDTRSTANGGLGHLVASRAVSFKVVNRTSDPTKLVPADATAVTGILTVTRQKQLGYFTLDTRLNNYPTTSTLNFMRDNRATGVTVPLSGGNLYLVYKANNRMTADGIFDVSGYFIY